MGNAQSWSPSTGPSPDPASLSEEIKDLKALRQDLRKQIEQAEASDGLSETQKLLLRDSKEVYINVEDVLDEWEYEQLLRAKIEGGSPNMTADPELWDRMADQIRKVKRKLEKAAQSARGRAPSSSLLGDDHDHKVRIVHYLVHKCPEDLTVFRYWVGAGRQDHPRSSRLQRPTGCSSSWTTSIPNTCVLGSPKGLGFLLLFQAKRRCRHHQGQKSCRESKDHPEPLYLEFKLSDDECWGLFKRYASDGNHPVMEDLREKVVEQCQGLPLAAKLLGISFRHHRGDKIDWADDCMDWVIEENIRPVLKSSYLELAPHLNLASSTPRCFPKVISLVDPPPKRETPWKRRRLDQEDEGLQNFDELVSGSFIIQDPEDWTQYSIPKLIWDLLNDISGEEEYVRRADMCDPLCKCRHLLLNPKDGSFRLYPDSFFDSPGLRSLIFMPRIKLRLEILDQDLSSNTSVTTLPESVGGLKHLRFLALNHTGITELPESKGKELCGLRELKALSKLTELGVSGLCNLADSEDAKEASMQDKKSLKVLKLNWCSDDDDAAAKSEQFKGIDYESFTTCGTRLTLATIRLLMKDILLWRNTSQHGFQAIIQIRCPA
ncbi:unnamed protein product [Spirodela intermedia]|uniref:R13L1/DRL21-like LRR repeat region domain-containing protein n=1 Tax=Spirodela intermedia TaxID=51605 RepID=A0A7I8JFQ5_SPIIN|nr:unnamed protein product [Spirodela intermedia]CAA6668986.1 unnamed protein product [Spirodela intermedia]